MNSIGVKTWTDARDQMLIVLHAQGLSFSEIGAELGVTRNAAIGRAGRIGLPMRKEPSPRHGRPKQTSADKPRAERKAPFRPQRNVIPLPKLVDKPPPQRKPLVELQQGECRWPYGDANFVFCALPAIDGQPYCGPHCRAAYHVARPIGERAQLAEWGVSWPPPKGWRRRLVELSKTTAGQAETDPPAAQKSARRMGV